MDFPLATTRQLSAHLKSLRKAKALTQTQLGRLIGVGQARMAAIEANPGVVNIEQLLTILHHLGARLSVQVPTPPGQPPASRSGANEDW